MQKAVGRTCERQHHAVTLASPDLPPGEPGIVREGPTQLRETVHLRRPLRRASVQVREVPAIAPACRRRVSRRKYRSEAPRLGLTLRRPRTAAATALLSPRAGSAARPTAAPRTGYRVNVARRGTTSESLPGVRQGCRRERDEDGRCRAEPEPVQLRRRRPHRRPRPQPGRTGARPHPGRVRDGAGFEFRGVPIDRVGLQWHSDTSIPGDHHTTSASPSSRPPTSSSCARADVAQRHTAIRQSAERVRRVIGKPRIRADAPKVQLALRAGWQKGVCTPLHPRARGSGDRLGAAEREEEAVQVPRRVRGDARRGELYRGGPPDHRGARPATSCRGDRERALRQAPRAGRDVDPQRRASAAHEKRRPRAAARRPVRRRDRSAPAPRPCKAHGPCWRRSCS